MPMEPVEPRIDRVLVGMVISLSLRGYCFLSSAKELSGNIAGQFLRACLETAFDAFAVEFPLCRVKRKLAYLWRYAAFPFSLHSENSPRKSAKSRFPNTP